MSESVVNMGQNCHPEPDDTAQPQQRTLGMRFHGRTQFEGIAAAILAQVGVCPFETCRTLRYCPGLSLVVRD
jgi:hypothetical protein